VVQPVEWDVVVVGGADYLVRGPQLPVPGVALVMVAEGGQKQIMVANVSAAEEVIQRARVVLT
jgi:hypothetical protein